MKILESPLMGEFIGYLKANWGDNSRVSQRRRRLRQLVAMVRGVADAAAPAVRGTSLNRWLQLLRWEALRGQAVLDATTDPTPPPTQLPIDNIGFVSWLRHWAAVVGSARKVLAGVKALFVCGAEVDRLADAVETLERLAGPGADLDIFLKVLQLDAAMDVDGGPDPVPIARYGEEGSYSVASAPGGKRKRGGSSGVDLAGEDDGDGDGEAALHSHGRAVVGRAYRHKRRALACYRRHATSGPLLAAGPDRSVVVTMAMAMARVRRRIGRPNLSVSPSPGSRCSEGRLREECVFCC